MQRNLKFISLFSLLLLVLLFFSGCSSETKRVSPEFEYDSQSRIARRVIEKESFWNEDSLIERTYGTLIELGRKAFQRSDVDSIEVIVRSNFIDEYGKKELKDAIWLKMPRKNFEKYNWKNLEYLPVFRQMKEACEKHWIHPAIWKKVNPSDLILSSFSF